MGWWSDLFKLKDVVIDSGLPKVSVTTTMPRVETPKQDKDISQPVYAIVKAMKERPSSFKAKMIGWNDEKYAFKYEIKDVKTLQSLEVCKSLHVIWNIQGRSISPLSYSWLWLTNDEQDLLLQTFQDLQDIKLTRLMNIRQIKKENEDKKERERMKAVYK